VAIYLYFVVAIDRDSYTEVLELRKIMDDKLVSLYQNLTGFKYGKVLIFKGELVDVQAKYNDNDLSFIEIKDILTKYEFLKDDKEKGLEYDLLKDYIENIYYGKENL
jgi:hypothetical protein